MEDFSWSCKIRIQKLWLKSSLGAVIFGIWILFFVYILYSLPGVHLQKVRLPLFIWSLSTILWISWFFKWLYSESKYYNYSIQNWVLTIHKSKKDIIIPLCIVINFEQKWNTVIISIDKPYKLFGYPLFDRNRREIYPTYILWEFSHVNEIRKYSQNKFFDNTTEIIKGNQSLGKQITKKQRMIIVSLILLPITLGILYIASLKTYNVTIRSIEPYNNKVTINTEDNRVGKLPMGWIWIKEWDTINVKKNN